jgi:hypothetical protein
MAVWNHADPIPNSVVKQVCGEDTLGVAPWEISSVPGYQYNAKGISHSAVRDAFCNFYFY